MPEERRSYVILRPDGFLLHTKPITWSDALWLEYVAYDGVGDRGLVARYLSEWGNVLDVGEHMVQLRLQLRRANPDLYYGITDVYGSPEEFKKALNWLLGRRNLPPEARQAVEELLGRAEDFLRRPVEPRPLRFPPVRYFKMGGSHVIPGEDRTQPDSLWHAYVEGRRHYELYGISVFEDSFWLWRQEVYGAGSVQAVAVRRDAGDGDIVAALARADSDEAAHGFLGMSAEYLRQLLREREAELASRGYGDVVRKAKVVLAAAELLTAGRKEEEGEGVPA